VFIAMWAQLTGGFFTFGTSVNSGRVFMLVLHLSAVVLLYFISRRISGNRLAGVIAVLVFSFSPLGIYFQRRVLLDNIMIFWILVSLALLLSRGVRLTRIAMSALCFGVAVLTKENAVFFIPAFIYIIYSRSPLHMRRLSLTVWLALMAMLVSWYVLFALLKGEFFPSGVWGGDRDHVSLISTLLFHLQRGDNLPFWHHDSAFYVNVLEWISRDPFTIGLGGAATLVSALFSIRVTYLRIPAFLALLFWVFLIRGKLIINFYVVPLIPLLALNIGVLAVFLIQQVSRGKRHVFSFLMTVFVALSLFSLVWETSDHWVRDETSPQQEAIAWIKEHISPQHTIVIDDALFVDLHAPRHPNDPVFPDADWAWKVEKDPEIRQQKLQGNWRNLHYMVLSHEILKQIKAGEFPLAKQALAYAQPMAEWRQHSTSFVDLPNYISTNGDWMSVYRLHNPEKLLLAVAWDAYRNSFIHPAGYVVDTQSGSITSEGQSYAMLRAVWQDDRQTFDAVWHWTRDHLQTRIQDDLFSWVAGYQDNRFIIKDSATASDADEDIALALLFAYRQWGDAHYLLEARRIINDIWEQEVVADHGRLYLMAGAESHRNDGYIVNPSYLSPATYRLFATVDQFHPWKKLVDDSYWLLTQLADRSVLPPNWVLVKRDTGALESAHHYGYSGADYHSYDAFRIFWRVALDAQWHREPRAYMYARRFEPFFRNRWQKNSLAAVYDTQGQAHVRYSTLSTTVGPLSLFSLANNALSHPLYQASFERYFNYDTGFWGENNHYYDQNWAWFGTALYLNQLPNLWRTPDVSNAPVRLTYGQGGNF
jgi:endoglucanase